MTASVASDRLVAIEPLMDLVVLVRGGIERDEAVSALPHVGRLSSASVAPSNRAQDLAGFGMSFRWHSSWDLSGFVVRRRMRGTHQSSRGFGVLFADGGLA